jgi:hypothetical protein
MLHSKEVNRALRQWAVLSTGGCTAPNRPALNFTTWDHRSFFMLRCRICIKQISGTPLRYKPAFAWKSIKIYDIESFRVLVNGRTVTRAAGM